MSNPLEREQIPRRDFLRTLGKTVAIGAVAAAIPVIARAEGNTDTQIAAAPSKEIPAIMPNTLTNLLIGVKIPEDIKSTYLEGFLKYVIGDTFTEDDAKTFKNYERYINLPGGFIYYFKPMDDSEKADVIITNDEGNIEYEKVTIGLMPRTDTFLMDTSLPNLLDSQLEGQDQNSNNTTNLYFTSKGVVATYYSSPSDLRFVPKDSPNPIRTLEFMGPMDLSAYKKLGYRDTFTQNI